MHTASPRALPCQGQPRLTAATEAKQSKGKQSSEKRRPWAERRALLVPAKAPSRSPFLSCPQNRLHTHPSQKRRPCPKDRRALRKFQDLLLRQCPWGVRGWLGATWNSVLQTPAATPTWSLRGKGSQGTTHPYPRSPRAAACRDPAVSNCRLALPSWWPAARTRFIPEGRATDGREGGGVRGPQVEAGWR